MSLDREDQKLCLIGAGQKKERGGSIMMGVLSQKRKKYKKYYFGLNDKIKKGTKVVYFPSRDCFVYYYHDYGYVRGKFKPGDIMTVKMVRKDEPCYSVYVYENNGIFSPAELLPAEVVNKEDIKKVVDFYRQYKKNHKL